MANQNLWLTFIIQLQKKLQKLDKNIKTLLILNIFKNIRSVVFGLWGCKKHTCSLIFHWKLCLKGNCVMNNKFKRKNTFDDLYDVVQQSIWKFIKHLLMLFGAFVHAVHMYIICMNIYKIINILIKNCIFFF